MSETYYPAHSSRPVAQLPIVGPTADAESPELMQLLLAELKAAIASKPRVA